MLKIHETQFTLRFDIFCQTIYEKWKVMDAFITFSKDPLGLNLQNGAVNLWIDMVPGLRPDEPSKKMTSQEILRLKMKAQNVRKEQAKITKLKVSVSYLS